MIEVDSLMVKIALIGLFGVGAQWIAWRTGRSAIALMLAAGIIAGPVLGILNPEEDFGELQEPIVKLAVAVILFEGGLSLNFRELRHAGWAVARLIFIGVPVGWALGTAAAYYGAGLSLPVSALFGGILVVTGPTVIGPMLRSLRIGRRPADILKWEGIVNDPIGALLAVGIFAWVTYEGEPTFAAVGLEVLLSSFVAGLLGAGLGFAVTWLFPRGYVPEFLKAPVLLIFVIGGFVLADLIRHETGLITVTIMGIVMANRPIYSLTVLRRFKEDLAVLLISGVFILLSARLDWEIVSAFQAQFVLFLILLLFVVRPLTVLVSMLFSDVPWNERLFIAWIAPRGIVAVAITGLFALRLVDYGFAEAEALIPLSFAVVIATVLAHGMSAPWLAERLGLNQGPSRGVLLVGANGWVIEFGAFLKKLGLPVTVADPSKYALREARRRGLETWRGDVLEEARQDKLDMGQFQQLITATENDAYNALICADLGPEMGYDSVSQVGNDPERGGIHARGRVLMRSAPPMEDLLGRHEAGWRFSRTNLTDEYGFEDHLKDRPKEGESVAVLKPDKRLLFFSTESKPVTEPGDVLISYLPPGAEKKRNERKAAQAAARSPAPE